MASCPSCGSGLTGAARYCSACGASADAAGFEAVGNDRVFEVIDMSVGVHPAYTNAAGGPRLQWAWAAAAVAVVGLLGWTLTRSSDEPGQVEQLLGQDRESEDDPGASTTTTQNRPSTSRRPPTTTSVGVPGLATAEGVAEGEPLLGEPVGLRLYVGGSALSIVDLDTGSVSERPIRDAPVGVHGDRLLLRADSGTLSSRLLSDLDDEPTTLSTDQWLPFVPTDDPGFVWVIRYSDSGTTTQWSSISVADGSVRSTLGTQNSLVFAPSPEVVGTSSGGVFELDEDNADYRRLADGTPLASSDKFVLVQSCAAPTTCRNYWIDRSSGREVDRFVPPIEGTWGAWSSPGGQLLATQGSQGTLLWDIDRGAEVALLPYNDWGQAAIGLSADGRFAAFGGPQKDGLVIYDAVSGTSHKIGLPGQRESISGLAFGPASGQP